MDGDKIAENQRSGQPLVIDIVFKRVRDHRHADSYALVATAGIAHRRELASRHPGVRRGSGHPHGEADEIVSEDLLLVLPDGLAYIKPIVTVQTFMGKRKVQVPVRQDEPDVLECGALGE